MQAAPPLSSSPPGPPRPSRAELERLRGRARRRMALSALALLLGLVLLFVGRALINEVLAAERAAGRDLRPWDVLDQTWPGIAALGAGLVMSLGGTLSLALNALYVRHVSRGIDAARTPE